MRYRHFQSGEGRRFPLWAVAVVGLVLLVPLSYWTGSCVARGSSGGSEGLEEPSTAAERGPSGAGAGSDSPADEGVASKVEVEIEEAAGYVAERSGLLELGAAAEDRWRPVNVGEGVFIGNGVRVAAEGSARLRLKGWGDLDLSEGAGVELQKGGVELIEGTLRVRLSSSEQVFTVTTEAGEILGRGLQGSITLPPYGGEVQVTVHGGRATLRNEAGEVALGAGVQASAEEPQPPVVHGVRPSGAMEETLAGRVLEVKGGTLRVQTEEGTVVTARVGAEGQGGVWYRARVGRSLRSLQVGDPVAIKFWSDARDQWLTAVNRRPRPQAAPVEAEEPPALAGEGQVSGQVTSATGQPLAGVEVELQDEGGVLERAITDDRGQFRMAHVPAGTYHLLATAPDGRQGQSADVQVDTNQTVAVPLTLPAAPSRTEPPEERGDTSKGPNGF